MKKTYKISLLLFAAITLGSCATSMNAVWEKDNYNPRDYTKVAVVAISKNLEARQQIESAIISEIRELNPNIEVVSGLDLLPPNVGKDKWKATAVEAVLKESHIDAVLTTSMVDNYTTEEMSSSGRGIYLPSYYRVGPYVYRTYDYMYSSPKYDIAETFVLQSNLFDLKEGNKKEDVLVWQGQSNVVNPTSVPSAAKSYAKNLIAYLQENYLR